MARKPNKKRRMTIMVSSTVYGIEDLLDQIYAVLTRFGYEVWMSHRGTVTVNSNDHPFESSLKAVDECDLFLGLVTPQYGSGVATGEISITHQEFIRAIDTNKPRWFLAHEYVVFARLLLRGLGYKKPEEREAIPLFDGAGTLDDLRVIDMYEAASRNAIKFKDRTGSWVQKFSSLDDAMLFTTAQFHRYQEIENFLRNNFQDPAVVRSAVEAKSDGK
jgi:hypothetical protein